MEVSTDVAGPISTAIAMRPVENVLRDVRREPEKLHQLMDYCVECSLEWVKLFCEQMESCSVGISDPVTTTDELIPSGETSSYRSNPLGLAEFTLSRKDPAYVGRAKEVQKAQKAIQEGKCPVEWEIFMI